jgi:hypothetical protein
MHTCLTHDHVRALLYLFNANFHGDRSWPRAYVILVQTKTDRCHAHVIHSAVLLFPFAVSRMVVVRWQIAPYSYVSSRLAS